MDKLSSFSPIKSVVKGPSERAEIAIKALKRLPADSPMELIPGKLNILANRYREALDSASLISLELHSKSTRVGDLYADQYRFLQQEELKKVQETIRARFIQELNDIRDYVLAENKRRSLSKEVYHKISVHLKMCMHLINDDQASQVDENRGVQNPSVLEKYPSAMIRI